MYVCMHACVYESAYVCMYVCMYVWICLSMYVCMYESAYLSMYVCTYIVLYLHIFILTFIHSYIHTYFHTYVHTYRPGASVLWSISRRWISKTDKKFATTKNCQQISLWKTRPWRETEMPDLPRQNLFKFSAKYLHI